MVTPENKNDSVQKYFKKELFILKLIGISFAGNESWGYKIYSLLIITFSTVLYPILQMGDVFKQEFSNAVDILTYVFGAIIAYIKAMTLLGNRTRMHNLLKKFQYEPFVPNEERGGEMEVKFIREGLWFSSMQTMVYGSMVAGTTIMAVSYSLFKRIKSSDYHDWEFTFCPFTILNVTYSPNFEILWLYQSVSLSVVSGFVTATDLLISAVLINISYQLKILQNYLKCIVESSYRKMLKDNERLWPNVIESNFTCEPSIIPWKYLKESFRDAMEYHLAIIEIVKEMENAFSIPLLMIYLNTLIMLCFTIYHASMFPLTDIRLVRCMAQVLCMGLQVLTVCYWGEQMMFEGEQVGRTAYQCNFIGTDLRFEKNLILIIRRSRNPIKLTAGGFADISLSMFAWIMRTSYSAFMVLRTTGSKYDY